MQKSTLLHSLAEFQCHYQPKKSRKLDENGNIAIKQLYLPESNCSISRNAKKCLPPTVQPQKTMLEALKQGHQFSLASICSHVSLKLSPRNAASVRPNRQPHEQAARRSQSNQSVLTRPQHLHLPCLTTLEAFYCSNKLTATRTLEPHVQQVKKTIFGRHIILPVGLDVIGHRIIPCSTKSLAKSL